MLIEVGDRIGVSMTDDSFSRDVDGIRVLPAQGDDAGMANGDHDQTRTF